MAVSPSDEGTEKGTPPVTTTSDDIDMDDSTTLPESLSEDVAEGPSVTKKRVVKKKIVKKVRAKEKEHPKEDSEKEKSKLGQESSEESNLPESLHEEVTSGSSMKKVKKVIKKSAKVTTKIEEDKDESQLHQGETEESKEGTEHPEVMHEEDKSHKKVLKKKVVKKAKAPADVDSAEATFDSTEPEVEEEPISPISKEVSEKEEGVSGTESPLAGVDDEEQVPEPEKSEIDESPSATEEDKPAPSGMASEGNSEPMDVGEEEEEAEEPLKSSLKRPPRDSSSTGPPVIVQKFVEEVAGNVYLLVVRYASNTKCKCRWYFKNASVKESSLYTIRHEKEETYCESILEVTVRNFTPNYPVTLHFLHVITKCMSQTSPEKTMMKFV